MALSQRLDPATDSVDSKTVSSSEPLTGPPGTPEKASATGESATEKRKPLLFEPEPSQRMVVVRRRKRRKTQQIDKSEQAAGRVRLVLFGLVVVLLIVAVSGQHFAQALLLELEGMVRPLKSAVHVPKMEVIALVLAALILLYMMPGVESKVKRWLGMTKPNKNLR